MRLRAHLINAGARALARFGDDNAIDFRMSMALRKLKRRERRAPFAIYEMSSKKIVGIWLAAIAVAGGLSAGVFYTATKNPTPIRGDPKNYGDYTGYYLFSRGDPVTVPRERHPAES